MEIEYHKVPNLGTTFSSHNFDYYTIPGVPNTEGPEFAAWILAGLAMDSAVHFNDDAPLLR